MVKRSSSFDHCHINWFSWVIILWSQESLLWPSVFIWRRVEIEQKPTWSAEKKMCPIALCRMCCSIQHITNISFLRGVFQYSLQRTSPWITLVLAFLNLTCIQRFLIVRWLSPSEVPKSIFKTYFFSSALFTVCAAILGKMTKQILGHLSDCQTGNIE